MNAGSIVATLKLKAEGFKDGLNSAKSQLDTFQSKSANVSKDLRNVGGTMATAGGAIAAGLGGAVKTAAGFEGQMSKVKAISGATDKDFAKLRDTAKDLGAKTAFSASQAGEGMEYLALAGWDTSEIIGGMPGLLDLAAAGGLELGRAADITSDTMQAFGMKATDAGHAADVFAYAQANANTNVEQMGEGMKYFAPIANSFGWSLEESSAGMMALADSGLKGSIAGQAFASSLGRLAKPTRQMSNVMKDTNMEFFDAQGQLKSLPDLIAEVEKGTKGMTDEQRAATLSTLFGAEAYKHWAILLDRGSDELANMTTELENSDGTAKEMADTMLDNLNGAITILKSGLEGLSIAIGEVLIPYLTVFAKWLTNMVERFNGLSDGTKKAIVIFAALTAAIGLLGGGFLIFLSFIPNIIGGFKSFIAVAKLATTGVKLFGTAMKFLVTSPFGLVILGIVALIAAIVLIVKHWDKVKEFTIAAWEFIKVFLIASWELIKAGMKFFGEAIAVIWKGIWTGIKMFFTVIWEGIKAFATAIWYGIKAAAVAVFNGLKAYFSMILYGYKLLFTTIWNAIKAIVMAVWNGLKAGASLVFNGIKAFFTAWLNGVKLIFTTVWNAIKTAVMAVWNGMKSAATSVFNGMKAVLTTIMNAIKNVFVQLWNILKGRLVTIWNSIKSLATNTFNSMKSALITIVTAIKNTFISIFNAIKATISAIWNSIKSTTSSVWNGIKGIISNVIGGIKSTVSSGANFLKSSFVGAINAVKSAFSNMWGSIKGSLDKVVNGIKNAAAKGKEYLQALNPFKRNSPSLVDNVKSGVGVIKKTYDGVADMRINSPKIGSVTAGLGVDVESAFSGKDNGGGGGGSNYNAPLVQVENMNVRDDEDVRKVSRELFNLQRSHDRSQGGR